MPIIAKTIDCLFRGRRFYVAVLFVCLLEWLVMSVVAPNCYFDSDSVSYFYPVNLFAGRISPSRPPVYCLFLNALRCFGDTHLKTCVVSIQFGVLLGTILLAAKMLRALFHHAIPVLVACGYCALQGYFWAKSILPECFTFCVVVLAVYLFWRMTVAPSHQLVWALNSLISFAIMLKPVFAVLGIALFLAWLFRIVVGDEDKHHIRAIALSYGFSVVVVLAYCSLMQVRYGMFGVSSVLVQNDLLNIVSSSAWTTCNDSLVKALLDDELKNNKDTYAGVFALQWAVKPIAPESTDPADTCPQFLFESENAVYCRNLREKYNKGTLFEMNELLDFIREAKRQPSFVKYTLQKLFIAIGAPQGRLTVPFWLGFTSLVISFLRRDHLVFFANLLFLGFIASVILKIDILYADAGSESRLLYPGYMIPWMDLLYYFNFAFPQGRNMGFPRWKWSNPGAGRGECREG